MEIKVESVDELEDGVFVNMHLDKEAQAYFMEKGFNQVLKEAIALIAKEK
jgi:hypothetical protein